MRLKLAATFQTKAQVWLTPGEFRRSIRTCSLAMCSSHRRPLPRTVRPVAQRAGIRKPLGWHTLRPHAWNSGKSPNATVARRPIPTINPPGIPFIPSLGWPRNERLLAIVSGSQRKRLSTKRQSRRETGLAHLFANSSECVENRRELEVALADAATGRGCKSLSCAAAVIARQRPDREPRDVAVRFGKVQKRTGIGELEDLRWCR